MHRLAILGDGPAGDLDSLLREDVRDAVVRERLAAILRGDSVYFQGCSAFLVQTDDRDAVSFFTDWSVGWFAYQNPAARCVTSVVPIVASIASRRLRRMGESSTRNTLNCRTARCSIRRQDASIKRGSLSYF